MDPPRPLSEVSSSREPDVSADAQGGARLHQRYYRRFGGSYTFNM